MSRPSMSDEPPAPLHVARSTVATFQALDPEQAAAQTQILSFIDRHPDALHRSCTDGHLTGSALVVDAGAERAVLLLHAKLGRWLQPGGHADGDGDLARVALLEATEETGIPGLRPVPDPVDLDVHVVDPPDADPHIHLDVRYVLVAPPGAVPVGNRESDDVAWVPESELATSASFDTSLRRLAFHGFLRARSVS